MVKYEITVDLEACDGIFACLVRDDRFEEAEDGLVTIRGGKREGGHQDASEDAIGEILTATFEDDRLADSEDAAAACPTDAIEVTEL
jgi:ferredoxin